MAQRVAGDLYHELDGQLCELKRQLRQLSGYPFDPLQLREHLQAGIEGRFSVVRSSLLKPLGTVPVPYVHKFVARRNFIVDTSAGASPKISYLSDNFPGWFGDKVEKVPSGTLQYAELLKSSVDGPILAELGNTAEVTLANIFALMERQPNGEKAGALFTNGRANIFYVKDVGGTLRAVDVYWRGDGWDVNAYSVSSPDRWRDGNRVFSRNSSATLTA